MNRWNWRRWVLPPLLCWWAVGAVHAEITQSDRDLVERVSHRLLAVTDPVPDYIWPPTFGVLDDEKEIQAHAFAHDEDGKTLPRVEVTSRTLHQVIQGDPDRLALILGHELGMSPSGTSSASPVGRHRSSRLSSHGSRRSPPTARASS